jgi:uncharacterized protein YkwD
MRRPLVLLFAALASISCTPRQAPFAPGDPIAPAAPVDAATPRAGDDSVFANVITSPQPPANIEGLSGKVMQLCDESDAALAEVAMKLARRLQQGAVIPDTAEIAYEIRAAGAPYVWPRAWSLSGGGIDDADATKRAAAWLGGIVQSGTRRCGAALVRGESEALVLLLSDVVADLSPLESRARTGQWLSFTAKLLVPATDAKLVLLGPRGAPKPVPTQYDRGVARARFAASEPGPWTAQLLADLEAGPRPVAEAMFFADVPPPPAYAPHPAPGEQAESDANPEAALLSMVNAARASEKVRPLSRSTVLDGIARAHASSMQEKKVLAHDLGAGGLAARIQTAGLSFRGYGENIARAQSPARAHRVIWASPSHRSNVVDPRYAQIGIGVVEAAGTLWVCEVFATSR